MFKLLELFGIQQNQIWIWNCMFLLDFESVSISVVQSLNCNCLSFLHMLTKKTEIGMTHLYLVLYGDITVKY